jgi:hypothetical protein
MATYKPIQSFTTTGSQSVVTFSNIPQDYTDLVIISNVVWTQDAYINNMRFNGDSGSNYSYTRITGNGTSAVSTRLGNINYAFGGWTGVNPTLNTVHIMNYSNSTKFKTSLVRTNIVTDRVAAYVNTWRNTAAITSITLTHESASAYSAGSTFSLYGIKSGAPQALGGDLVTTDGNYWYHTFNTTQTFTPQRPLTVDYLVVAGGGAGSYRVSGGGGAGGMRCTVTGTGGSGSLESVLPVIPIQYVITVGAGGAGGTSSVADGTNGSNSIFSTITSTGGGRPGSDGGSGTAASGGSGGGGSIYTTGGAASPSGQGFAGGSGQTPYTAGGGGGASAVGGNGTANAGGAGGAGRATSISGSSVTYAGGGGGASSSTSSPTGGAGGVGGGGAGTGNTTTGGSGTTNTGGGGGGGGGTNPWGAGGNGGSGIVIVRYPV